MREIGLCYYLIRKISQDIQYVQSLNRTIAIFMRTSAIFGRWQKYFVEWTSQMQNKELRIFFYRLLEIARARYFEHRNGALGLPVQGCSIYWMNKTVCDSFITVHKVLYDRTFLLLLFLEKIELWHKSRILIFDFFC